MQDLHGAVGMFFQPADDQIFVGIKLAWALSCFTARFVPGLVQPFADRLDVESGLGRDLTGTQVQFPAQTAHFMIGFKIDHAPLGPLARCCSRSLSTIALSDSSLALGAVP